MIESDADLPPAVDLTGNLIMIEKLVLGEIWTGDLPIFNPDALTSVSSRQVGFDLWPGITNVSYEIVVFWLLLLLFVVVVEVVVVYVAVVVVLAGLRCKWM